MTTGWQILRHFLIRAAGFPFGLIGGLAFEQSAAAIEQLLDYEDRLTALGARMHDLLHVAGDAEGAAVRRRCAKRVRQFRPIAPNPAERAVLGRDPLILIEEWDDAVSRREDARAHAAATFAAELTQRRSALREIAADGRFQEAVWLSSPTMLDRGVRRYVSRSAGAGELRRIERQVISYLQRFCAKNETASFFGPVDYGEFIAPDTTTSCGAQGGGPVARSNQAADDPHRAVAGAGTVRHREAFFAHWAVVVLADALAAHPLVGPHLRPRPTALYRLDPAAGTVQFPGTRCRLLDPAELGVLALADADMTITDIACQLGWPPGDVLRVATGLADAKLLTIAPRPPICEVHPLGWLRDWLAAAVRIDGRLSDVLAELDVMRSAEERFGAAPFDAKRALLAEAEQAFTSLTSARPRRGGGSFYADRLLLYEEACGGAGPLRVDQRLGALRGRVHSRTGLTHIHSGTCASPGLAGLRPQFHHDGVRFRHRGARRLLRGPTASNESACPARQQTGQVRGDGDGQDLRADRASHRSRHRRDVALAAHRGPPLREDARWREDNWALDQFTRDGLGGCHRRDLSEAMDNRDPISVADGLAALRGSRTGKAKGGLVRVRDVVGGQQCARGGTSVAPSGPR